MIDIETYVFDAVYPYLSDLVPEGSFTSVYVPAPAAFPHVSLCEMDNYPDKRTMDSGSMEWSSIIVYEAHVYAFSKTECKAVQTALDNAMIGLMGFTKMSGQFIPNIDDPALFQIVSRYERGVDRNHALYKP